MNNISLGKLGEEIATDFLKKRGMKILERNFRTPFGEIDIIASKNRKLHFVEVKTRRNMNFGRPFEAVNKVKMRHIINSAQFYLKGKDRDFEIDVISVLIKKNGEKEIEYIENVF